ncbi:lytic murein transglycosylase [Actinoplanes sp. M2I2]|uniref:lytic transglycosylase domain-containing protein n=1 Tax=Actinoplanes sp. M2I2 TaxID=1734444 RepID=UPI0020206767|nr:lytic murein transglycosylase [Actinoplanes sp. M2I2]
MRVVERVGRGTAAWAKRPSGRLIVPAVIAVLLLGAAGTAGAYLVPQALESASSPSATPGFPLGATGALPSAGQPVGPSGLPGGVPSGFPGGGQGDLPGGPGATGGLPGATGGLPGATGGLPGATGGVPGATGGLPGVPGGLPGATVPTGAAGATAGPTAGAQSGVRPADTLAGWAGQMGTRLGIPVVAAQAYGYAELVLQRTTPSCRLSWTTIAALAKIESSHGAANGAVLSTDGTALPPIFGLPLDGKGGRQLIPDTDRGALDQDTTYDRAVGPLQFIPATWNSYKVDADNNGVADPNDIDDASLTAATYLCQGGRNLTRPEAWWDAILSYNAVRPYAQKVFDAANDYGRRSRT